VPPPARLTVPDPRLTVGWRSADGRALPTVSPQVLAGQAARRPERPWLTVLTVRSLTRGPSASDRRFASPSRPSPARSIPETRRESGLAALDRGPGG